MSDNIRHVANAKPSVWQNVGHTNSDIAFRDNLAYVANLDGVQVYDISDPGQPVQRTGFGCGVRDMDISVTETDLFFLSAGGLDSSGGTCGVGNGLTVGNAKNFRSTKVDIPCGVRSHTMVPDKTGEAVYIYTALRGGSVAGCEAPNGLFAVVKVPLNDPYLGAHVVASTITFPETVPIPYRCVDITVYPEKDLAAASCDSHGLLLDISDREHPKVLASATNPDFASFTSATFNNKASKVVFTDKVDGRDATCNDQWNPRSRASAVYDIVDGQLVYRSTFKISRPQSDAENCGANTASLIPAKGRDIMVQAWYQGGTSVWDFTDSANPHEIAYFERGQARNWSTYGGVWAAHYYNGYIYNSDMTEGLDVLRIIDPRTNHAESIRRDILNPKTQVSYRE
ncbi:hypothetical protein AB0M44_47735 [Streptosporangium subroseum]|uniref:LVIVD repeat-containing protein n=1 Tax=Streptosporangium subroseum TaxID=106412 RepID=UPI00343C8D23